MRPSPSRLAAAFACTLAAAGPVGPAAAQPAAPPKAAPAAKAPPPGKPAAEPAPPPLVPCRTAAEVCFLGVVIGGEVAVLFTNAPNGKGIEAKPVAAAGPGGAAIDLKGSEGRVLMLTGSYDPKAGIKDAEVVETASPLLSLVVKAQLMSGGGEGPAPGAPARRR